MSTSGDPRVSASRRREEADRGRILGSRETDPLVQLCGLEKRYGAKRALGPIDLELDRREIVGVVGPDGAGKTTLLRSIAGLLEITAAAARVLGHDLCGDVTELKREIGYVPQAFSLHRDLSVIENLRFTGRLHRLRPEEFDRRAARLLERTGLAPFRERPAGALSGGMKQKLAIANALMVEPRLLVLDEPTAGVDVVARGEIWAMLEAETHRSLVLIATSYLDEAASCDRLAYLDGGRIVAFGTPSELRARASLALFRVWAENPRVAARGARGLPYVSASRACAGYARVEVRGDRAANDAEILGDLLGLSGARFAERMPVDMESTLLALARHAEGS
ncbi:MAG TPA: ABC transporter ATP-binding protein [Candidatus Binatia bacterium]|nr:ABC transporter ATP-binding protein [Candidatus Binatia bacterium]